MTTPLRILAFVPTLGGGGAEKHVARIARCVDPGLARIDVAVARRGGSYESELGRASIVDLGVAGIRSSTGSLAACAPRLRSAMTSGRWDAVIAFLERPALVALATHGTLAASSRPALLLSVQADPVSFLPEDPLGPVFDRAMRSLYRRADAVIAISDGVAGALRGYDTRLAPTVIPNACIDSDRPHPSGATRVRASIVAAGRLAPQKGFDVLLEAFARVRGAIPEASLRILGVGPDREALVARATSLGLGERVTFPGFAANPLEDFARSEVFCLSSRYEGLGMVVVEAMGVGTAIVSTDCPHGPREILEGGRCGTLVPVGDADALAEALIAMLRDPAERMRLSKLARIRADDFRADRIAARYVELVRTTLAVRAESRSKSRS